MSRRSAASTAGHHERVSFRARQQGCPPAVAIDDGGPLLALLDQFAEPDVDPERYEQLRDEVENQLSHEREWA